jgi:glycosyltransferase involved in cell wall biosynthesis
VTITSAAGNSHLTRITVVIPEMYRGMKIAAVVPARNEERLIGRTIWPVPNIVDTIYVIDDGSNDRTAEIVRHYAISDERIRLINHQKNKGVGAAIITGYRQAYRDGHDAFVVVGGDAQMDWLDLEELLKPISDGKADYTKGNRFMYGHSSVSPGNAWREMPVRRIFGNVTLSILTKLASGYFHINDSQMGYTSMHRRVFPRVNWTKARKGYGYPAEWLMRFHSLGVRVADVPVRAVYLKSERQTQIRVKKFMFYMLAIIVKGGFERVNREYLMGRVSLPTISLPIIISKVGGFFRALRTGIGRLGVPNRLSRVFGFRRHLDKVQSVPKLFSQKTSLQYAVTQNEEMPFPDMYGGLGKNFPMDFDIGKASNRILKKATQKILDSTMQGNREPDSLESLHNRIERVGKMIIDRLKGASA